MTETELVTWFDQYEGVCRDFADLAPVFQLSGRPDLCAMQILDDLAPSSRQRPMIGWGDGCLLFKVDVAPMLQAITPDHVEALCRCGVMGWDRDEQAFTWDV
jgi:hypothetical protein